MNHNHSFQNSSSLSLIFTSKGDDVLKIFLRNQACKPLSKEKIEEIQKAVMEEIEEFKQKEANGAYVY